jgi:hypothetical protein
VLSRFAARIVTGPLAFFAAWCIDISAYCLGLLRERFFERKG